MTRRNAMIAMNLLALIGGATMLAGLRGHAGLSARDSSAAVAPSDERQQVRSGTLGQLCDHARPRLPAPAPESWAIDVAHEPGAPENKVDIRYPRDWEPDDFLGYSLRSPDHSVEIKLQTHHGHNGPPTWDEVIQALEDDLGGVASKVTPVVIGNAVGCLVTGRAGRDTIVAKLFRVDEDIYMARATLQSGASPALRDDAARVIDSVAPVEPAPFEDAPA